MTLSAFERLKCCKFDYQSLLKGILTYYENKYSDFFSIMKIYFGNSVTYIQQKAHDSRYKEMSQDSCRFCKRRDEGK